MIKKPDKEEFSIEQRGSPKMSSSLDSFIFTKCSRQLNF